MQEVRIPKYGMSTVEVDVTTVHIAIGQSVAIGDPLIDVETDKIVSTLESDFAGIVSEISVVSDTTYEVGDLVCRISVA